MKTKLKSRERKDFDILFKVAVEEVAALASCTKAEARSGLRQAYKIAMKNETEKANRNWYAWLKDWGR